MKIMKRGDLFYYKPHFTLLKYIFNSVIISQLFMTNLNEFVSFMLYVRIKIRYKPRWVVFHLAYLLSLITLVYDTSHT